MTPLIVFDLDGTLVDSRLDLAGSANALLAERGQAPLSVDRVVGMVGEGARVLVGRVLAAAGTPAEGSPLDEALARFLAIYDQHLVDHTQAYPGIREALERLHRHATLAILTNKPGHHTTRLLDALDLRAPFAEVIGGDTRWPRKPDPSSLQHLMASAGATPDTTIMVGDSPVDRDAARQARARFCLAAYGFGHVPLDARDGMLVAADSRDVQAVLLAALGIA